MLQPKKNSHKEFDNEKKFLRLENSPPPPPHNFSNGPSLSGVRTLIITISPSRSIQLPQYSKLIVFRPFKFSTMTKKNRKKTRYFRFPPNLAHRKLIDLAKYVLSSSSRGVLSFTQRFFKRRRHWGFICRGFCEE